ncbi:MAG: hypothetical protein IJH59_08965, partial [Firmicutes bacterium]|nr:hypothetical protein [Bacillota bacterium]
ILGGSVLIAHDGQFVLDHGMIDYMQGTHKQLSFAVISKDNNIAFFVILQVRSGLCKMGTRTGRPTSNL